MKHKFKIIDEIKMWKRICPQCSKEIWYKTRDVVYRKSNLNRICRNCWIKNKTNILERNCPFCNNTLKYKSYKNFWSANKNNVKCRRCSKIGNSSRKGQNILDQHKLKLSISHTGKILSDKSKHKMRLSEINRMKRNGITNRYRNYNPNTCKYLDKLNEEKGWNLQHALNGGEVEIFGYFLDGYDKKRNIIVEYDEPRHEKPFIKKKDEIRQNNLINHLNCQFYRYKECKNELIKI